VETVQVGSAVTLLQDTVIVAVHLARKLLFAYVQKDSGDQTAKKNVAYVSIALGVIQCLAGVFLVALLDIRLIFVMKLVLLDFMDKIVLPHVEAVSTILHVMHKMDHVRLVVRAV
jgi:hypothetical protein